MTLPDRTLCWVEGPPWDRHCDPVDETLAASLVPGIVDRLEAMEVLKSRERLLAGAEVLTPLELLGPVLWLLGEMNRRGTDVPAVLDLLLAQLRSGVPDFDEVTRLLQEAVR